MPNIHESSGNEMCLNDSKTNNPIYTDRDNGHDSNTINKEISETVMTEIGNVPVREDEVPHDINEKMLLLQDEKDVNQDGNGEESTNGDDAMKVRVNEAERDSNICESDNSILKGERDHDNKEEGKLTVNEGEWNTSIHADGKLVPDGGEIDHACKEERNVTLIEGERGPAINVGSISTCNEGEDNNCSIAERQHAGDGRELNHISHNKDSVTLDKSDLSINDERKGALGVAVGNTSSKRAVEKGEENALIDEEAKNAKGVTGDKHVNEEGKVAVYGGDADDNDPDNYSTDDYSEHGEPNQDIEKDHENQSPIPECESLGARASFEDAIAKNQSFPITANSQSLKDSDQAGSSILSLWNEITKRSNKSNKELIELIAKQLEREAAGKISNTDEGTNLDNVLKQQNAAVTEKENTGKETAASETFSTVGSSADKPSQVLLTGVTDVPQENTPSKNIHLDSETMKTDSSVDVNPKQTSTNNSTPKTSTIASTSAIPDANKSDNVITPKKKDEPVIIDLEAGGDRGENSLLQRGEITPVKRVGQTPSRTPPYSHSMQSPQQRRRPSTGKPTPPSGLQTPNKSPGANQKKKNFIENLIAKGIPIIIPDDEDDTDIANVPSERSKEFKMQTKEYHHEPLQNRTQYPSPLEMSFLSPHRNPSQSHSNYQTTPRNRQMPQYDIGSSVSPLSRQMQTAPSHIQSNIQTPPRSRPMPQYDIGSSASPLSRPMSQYDIGSSASPLSRPIGTASSQIQSNIQTPPRIRPMHQYETDSSTSLLTRLIETASSHIPSNIENPPRIRQVHQYDTGPSGSLLSSPVTTSPSPRSFIPPMVPLMSQGHYQQQTHMPSPRRQIYQDMSQNMLSPSRGLSPGRQYLGDGILQDQNPPPYSPSYSSGRPNVGGIVRGQTPPQYASSNSPGMQHQFVRQSQQRPRQDRNLTQTQLRDKMNISGGVVVIDDDRHIVPKPVPGIRNISGTLVVIDDATPSWKRNTSQEFAKKDDINKPVQLVSNKLVQGVHNKPVQLRPIKREQISSPHNKLSTETKEPHLLITNVHSITSGTGNVKPTDNVNTAKSVQQKPVETSDRTPKRVSIKQEPTDPDAIDKFPIASENVCSKRQRSEETEQPSKERITQPVLKRIKVEPETGESSVPPTQDKINISKDIPQSRPNTQTPGGLSKGEYESSKRVIDTVIRAEIKQEPTSSDNVDSQTAIKAKDAQDLQVSPSKQTPEVILDIDVDDAESYTRNRHLEHVLQNMPSLSEKVDSTTESGIVLDTEQPSTSNDHSTRSSTKDHKRQSKKVDKGQKGHKKGKKGIKKGHANKKTKEEKGDSSAEEKGKVKSSKGDQSQKQFGCGDCGKTYTSKSSLAQHFKVHTREQPFECDVCGKHFSVKSSLKKHIYTHFKDKQ